MTVAKKIIRMCVAASSFASAGEMSDEDILKNFELVPEPPCKKIKAKEPRPPVNPFWYERNYVTVDGSKNCQIHQFAIYWMSNRISDIRKYTEATLYRYGKGKWVAEYGLDCIPKMRIRDKVSNRIYFVIDRDIDEYPEKQIAYYSGSWKKVRSYPGKYGIHTVGEGCPTTEECQQEERMVKRAVGLLANCKPEVLRRNTTRARARSCQVLSSPTPGADASSEKLRWEAAK